MSASPELYNFLQLCTNVSFAQLKNFVNNYFNNLNNINFMNNIINELLDKKMSAFTNEIQFQNCEYDPEMPGLEDF